MPILDSFSENQSFNQLSDEQKHKLLPFFRAWSWGIEFDDETCDLIRYQTENGHKLRLIAQSTILQSPPALLSISSNALIPVNYLAESNVPIDWIIKHHQNSKNASQIESDIREACKKASKKGKRNQNDEEQGISSSEIMDISLSEDQIIALYNKFESPYTFMGDCTPFSYARHIHMSTLATSLGFNLFINQIQHTFFDGGLNLFATLNGILYDPNLKNNKSFYAEGSPVIHDGTCGYHTILILIKEAWVSLPENEKKLLLNIKDDFFCTFEINSRIEAKVLSFGCNPPYEDIDIQEISFFNHARTIGYGILMTAILLSIGIIGWPAMLAILTKPTGPVIITGLIIYILFIELVSAQNEQAQKLV